MCVCFFPSIRLLGLKGRDYVLIISVSQFQVQFLTQSCCSINISWMNKGWIFGRRTYVWLTEGLGYVLYSGVLGHSQIKGHGTSEHDIGSQGVSRLCSELAWYNLHKLIVTCIKTRLNRASESNSYFNVHCCIISSSKTKTLGKWDCWKVKGKKNLGTIGTKQ